jgi:transcriptional regulator with XRE-family HTH domain
MAIEPTVRRKRCYNRDEIIAKIKAKMVGRLKTQHAFAQSIGVSQPMLSQILNKERLPGEEMLKKLGLVFVEHFEETN